MDLSKTTSKEKVQMALEMDRPTQEQVKKVWEWCSFKESGYSEIWQYEQYKETNHWWEAPNGRRYRELPPIDLDNLFRYAVPKLQANGHPVDLTAYEQKGYLARVYKNCFDRNPTSGAYEPFLSPISEVKSDDPTLALFWAIYQVIEE